MGLRTAAAGVLFFVGLAVNSAAGEVSWTEEYRRMQGWRVAQGAIAVPPEGVTFTRDVATWRLVSGTLKPLEPLADGFVPGFVFEGKGRFTMEIPDPFEQVQLRRFTNTAGLTRVDEPFTKLVLRTSSPLAGTPAPPAPPTGWEASPLLTRRSEEWLRRASWDVDARVLAARLTPGDDYLLVDMDTASHGWLSFEFDPERQEEVSLVKLQELNDWVERWVSLDRASERDSAGRPTSPHKPAMDVTLVTINVDLTQHSGSPFDAEDGAKWDKASYSSKLAFLPQREGAKVLRLYLHPKAKVIRVTTAEGYDLPFLRDHLGSRFAGVDNDVYDGHLTVLLPQPLQRNSMTVIGVDYEMKQYNYASGRSWYPGEPESFNDLHQAKVTFHLPKKFRVRCVGSKGEERQEGDTLVSTWSTEKPTKMIGYSFGKGFKEERIELEGAPAVVAFGSPTTATTGNMVRNVAIDVSKALHFYQWYFGVSFPFAEMQATSISGYHGQAFEGLLHLSQLTFNAENPGASELFRAHEAAHAIWGHMVGWKSYRDQWLSEAFAEYSAMLFVEATLPQKKFFEEILQIYRNEQTGSIQGVFSKFARPWNVGLRSDQLRELGPISAGWRASTARLPQGYQIQAYNKGALVLHMLRTLLSGIGRDRDLFREVMQDFLTTYTGKLASTDDFQRVLEAKTGLSWQTFFDTWVHGTHIPEVTWSHEVGKAPSGKPALTVRATVAGVPSQFVQPVPVQVTLKGDRTATFFFLLKSPEAAQTIELPEPPKKVVFAPRFALLAKLKER